MGPARFHCATLLSTKNGSISGIPPFLEGLSRFGAKATIAFYFAEIGSLDKEIVLYFCRLILF